MYNKILLWVSFLLFYLNCPKGEEEQKQGIELVNALLVLRVG